MVAHLRFVGCAQKQKPTQEPPGKQAQGPAGAHALDDPHMQFPDVHRSVESPSHARPHAPQWSKLLVVLVQSVPQHASDAAQVRPHAPQCSTLFSTVTQLPPQQRCVPRHATPAPHRQTPATQLSPAAQAGSQGTSVVHVPAKQTSSPLQVTPHAPQFAESADVSRHAPSQQDCPVVHAAPAPHMQVRVVASQVSPSAHAGSQGGITHAPASHT